MTNTAKTPPPGGEEMPLVAHLLELRDRLLRIVLIILLVFLALTPIANTLFTVLADPLLRYMPENTQMIAIDPVGPFFTPFKLALVIAIFLVMPYILYHIWSFIAPALYTNERDLLLPLLISSSVLFYLGMAFSYFVVFPLVFHFMLMVTPTGVAMMTDISHYLDFVLKLFFAFGIAFEVPVLTILLVWTGMTTPEALAEKRPYIVVSAFVVGMLMTPPDAISQTLLALPIWLLFEIGLFFSKIMLRKKEAREAAEENTSDDMGLAEIEAEFEKMDGGRQDRKK